MNVGSVQIDSIFIADKNGRNVMRSDLSLQDKAVFAPQSSRSKMNLSFDGICTFYPNDVLRSPGCFKVRLTGTLDLKTSDIRLDGNVELSSVFEEGRKSNLLKTYYRKLELIGYDVRMIAPNIHNHFHRYVS